MLTFVRDGTCSGSLSAVSDSCETVLRGAVSRRKRYSVEDLLRELVTAALRDEINARTNTASSRFPGKSLAIPSCILVVSTERRYEPLPKEFERSN
jgi:hypothetical protein